MSTLHEDILGRISSYLNPREASRMRLNLRTSEDDLIHLSHLCSLDFFSEPETGGGMDHLFKMKDKLKSLGYPPLRRLPFLDSLILPLSGYDFSEIVQQDDPLSKFLNSWGFGLTEPFNVEPYITEGSPKFCLKYYESFSKSDFDYENVYILKHIIGRGCMDIQVQAKYLSVEFIDTGVKNVNLEVDSVYGLSLTYRGDSKLYIKPHFEGLGHFSLNGSEELKILKNQYQDFVTQHLESIDFSRYEGDSFKVTEKIIEILNNIKKGNEELRRLNLPDEKEHMTDEDIRKLVEHSPLSSTLSLLGDIVPSRSRVNPCVVCLSNERDIEYHPCGHSDICSECTHSLESLKCSRCGVKIHDISLLDESPLRGVNFHDVE
jgi:hypothetical protein